jgi:hypothetical protein
MLRGMLADGVVIGRIMNGVWLNWMSTAVSRQCTQHRCDTQKEIAINQGLLSGKASARIEPPVEGFPFGGGTRAIAWIRSSLRQSARAGAMVEHGA